VNKQERTYTVLRDRIHSGAFAPRARLNIDGLARELGVSAIPVREALRRLEAEGWVRFQPNVGAIVAPVDATTWEQEMVAVAILEGAATADAAAHLRLSDLSRLRRIAAEMEAVAAAHGDPVKFSRLNRRLHATIVARCGNAYLLELLEQTYLRLDRIRSTMFAYLPERFKPAITEHAHLIDLLETRDQAAIEQYARWHKLQTVAAYRATHEPQLAEGFADPSGHTDRVAEQLLPGEVDDLISRLAQHAVSLEFGDSLFAAVVLQQPVGLRDHAVSPPEEINPRDHGAIAAGDVYLKLRSRQSLLMENDPRARLKRRLSQPVRELNHPPRSRNPWPAITSQKHPA
jgi:DNA-binding GntR family transcriptional regulator